MNIDDYIKLRAKAHSIVAYAVRTGALEALTDNSICTDCGGKAVYYEHRDYEIPLHVDPICARCNSKRGRAKPEITDFTRRIKKNFSLEDREKAETTGFPIYDCLRCDHDWVPRKNGRPHVCPKCHSPLWDQRKEKK